MFNTLKYAKMLEEAGFSREEAEASIKILVEIMEDKLATKLDLREFEGRITLANKQDLKDLETRLTLRMGAMLAASVTVMTGIATLLQKLS